MSMTRRDFLVNASGAAGCLALPRWGSAAEASPGVLTPAPMRQAMERCKLDVPLDVQVTELEQTDHQGVPHSRLLKISRYRAVPPLKFWSFEEKK